MLDGLTSFLMGFNAGSVPGAAKLSPREVAANWTSVDVDAFLNGYEDGLAGDRWRVDRLLKQLREGR